MVAVNALQGSEGRTVLSLRADLSQVAKIDTPDKDEIAIAMRGGLASIAMFALLT